MTSKFRHFLLAGIAAWVLAAFGRLPAQSYNFLHYSVADGLPQSEIHTAMADSRGYLWLGAPGGGLSRFDGRNFVNFTTEDGLPSNIVQAILEDGSGRIWVGTSAGLVYYDGRIFHPVPFASSLSVTALARQTDSTLWVGTDRGLYQCMIPQQRLEKVRLNVLLDQLPIQALYASGRRLWIGTGRGAWRLGGGLVHIDRLSGLAAEDVRAFTRGPDGQLWILTYDHFDQGVAIFNEATMEITGYRQPPALVRALCAHTDAEQRVWIGTQDRGIFVYDPGEDRWQNISEENGLPHNHVRAISSDPWGNIWVAMAGGGLARYLGQSFIHFDRRDGLPDNRIYALSLDPQNRLWISAGNSGLTLYDDREGFRPMNRDSGLINVPARALLAGRQSGMWVGTAGLGLFLFDTTGMRRFSTLEGLPSNWITHLEEDALGNIWIATPADGLARLDQRNFLIDRIGLEEGVEEREISALQTDRRGRIWFATRQGKLGYFENGRLRTLYGKGSGLPGVEIRAIVFDSRGRVWLGTAGSGLFQADTGADTLRFQALTSVGPGLTSRNINLLIFDPDGHLWAGHERGVDKLLFNPAGMVTDIQYFGPNEGFPGLETYSGAALVDREGRLWLGTANGLIRRRPVEQSPEKSAPLIHLGTVSLFYQPLEKTAFATWAQPGGVRPGLSLPYRENHLGFSFKGINLSDPLNVRYRWRLEGLEEEWSPLSENESVYYSNLSPGAYVFQVQACSGENLCSEPVEAAFRIKSPVWQLWWFRLAAGVVLLALIFGGFFWRLRTIQRQEKNRREKLEVQNHLLQLEQKALQLQMNPHFIFNALNSIQSLVSTRDFQTARQEIGHFAGLMRVILSNSRKQQISLREEMDTLEKYLRMEQFCQRVDFTYMVYPPAGTDPEEVSIPPMLIQPFVENAVIHGIAHLPADGRIEIRFSLEEEVLTCEITDNGVGRKRAAELRRTQRPGHQSTAMQVTGERLEALWIGRPVKALEIFDLEAEGGKAAGTRVVLRIPAEVGF